jgi:plasmid stabilization system protein ParE
MRPPDVPREVEYLEEAVEEAEAAARWYAKRSAAAAAGFTDEIDAAESAIVRSPKHGPGSITTRVGTCFGAIHSASSIVSNPAAS